MELLTQQIIWVTLRLMKLHKAIAYIRFSSDEQADGNSIERQEGNIRRYAERMGFTIVEVLIDDGYSASKGDHISKGKFGVFLANLSKYRDHVLIVEEMDRLSRLGIRETRALLDRILSAGVEIHISQTGRVIGSQEDITTEILNTLESFAAAEYSRKLKDRVGKGWAKKKRSGKVVTSKVPFWLEVKDGKIVETAQVALVREWFRLAAMGRGSKRISCEAGGALATIQKTLSNRAVLGEYQPCKVVNKKRVPDGEPIAGYFPEIITPTEWTAARAEIDRKNRINGHRSFCSKNAGAENLFGGLLRDVTTEPHRTLFFQKQSPGHAAFLTSAYVANRKCNRFPYARFEKAFLGFLPDLDWQAIANEGRSEEEITLQKELDAKLGELDRITRRIATTEAAMNGDDIEPGTMRILAGKLANDETAMLILTEETEALQAKLGALKAQSAALASPEPLMEAIQDPLNVEMRLRTITEIRKRITRIEFNFISYRDGLPVVLVVFRNGAKRIIIIGEEKATLMGYEAGETPRYDEMKKTERLVNLT